MSATGPAASKTVRPWVFDFAPAFTPSYLLGHLVRTRVHPAESSHGHLDDDMTCGQERLTA